jgi:hypothetical protein
VKHGKTRLYGGFFFIHVLTRSRYARVASSERHPGAGRDRFCFCNSSDTDASKKTRPRGGFSFARKNGVADAPWRTWSSILLPCKAKWIPAFAGMTKFGDYSSPTTPKNKTRHEGGFC